MMKYGLIRSGKHWLHESTEATTTLTRVVFSFMVKENIQSHRYVLIGVSRPTPYKSIDAVKKPFALIVNESK